MPLAGDDAKGLELIEKFLKRLRTDPRFAEAYHKDPATAMQDEFPGLRQMSKDRILKTIEEAAGSAPSGPVAFGRLAAALAAAAAVVVANAVSAGAMSSEPAPE